MLIVECSVKKCRSLNIIKGIAVWIKVAALKGRICCYRCGKPLDV